MKMENENTTGHAPTPDNTALKEQKVKLKRPPLYKVILLNDDYTPMDFVVSIIVSIFNKPVDAAKALMLEIHKNGKAVCGVYPFEVAETKMLQVLSIAKGEEHPLQCVIEKE